MKLTMKQIIPAMLTDVFKRIDFNDKSQIRILNYNQGQVLKMTDIFAWGHYTGTIRQLYKYIKDLSPLCSWCCGNNGDATKIMPDGLLVCDDCYESCGKFYVCKICGKDLGELGSFARHKLQEMVCQDVDCKKREDISYGRLCCMKAVRVGCVCAYAYKCPVHAPNEMHIGTHD